MGDDCYALALPLDIYAAFALRKQFCIDMEIDFKDLINARIELNSFCENNEVD